MSGGISLSVLRDEKRSIRIQFGADVLRCEVYPDRLTNEVMDRYRDAQDDPKDYDEMSAAFGEFVASWNVLGDDGEPLPINGETFASKISLRVLNHIWSELVEAITPKSRKRNER